MTLSFASVTLPLSTTELEQWLAQVQPLDGFTDTDLFQYHGFNLERLPTPSWPYPRSIRPGVLRWPTGAVNSAWFHAVVGRDQVDAIRSAVGNPQTPQPLVMSDGRSGKTITASMYLLPFRPLSQFGTTHPVYRDGYLLTLCDQRFFWWFKYGDINLRTSWNALLLEIAVNLGIDLQVDAIDPHYAGLPPTEKWLGSHRPMATVLDAALAQVGQRLVCLLDGTVKTTKWVTAKAASDAQMDGRHVIAGGFVDPLDLARSIPRTVGVFFASGGGGCCAPAPYVVAKGANFVPSLSGLELLADASGSVYGDAIFDGTNAVALDKYAETAATDWYGWRTADVDVVFPGVEPWTPTGWEEYAEWTYQKREEQPYASTTVRRGEWDALPSGTWEVGDCCEFFVEITGGSESAGYSGFRVAQLGPNQWLPVTEPLPVTFAGNIWRAKSNETEASGHLPPIEAEQVVKVWRSPTYGPVSGVPQYQCHPWGAQKRVGPLLKSNCTAVYVWGRDLIEEAVGPPSPPVIIAKVIADPPPGPIQAPATVTLTIRDVAGGTPPYTASTDDGNGNFLSGFGPTLTYLDAGTLFPKSIVTDSVFQTSPNLAPLGGDGTGSFAMYGGTRREEDSTPRVLESGEYRAFE